VTHLAKWLPDFWRTDSGSSRVLVGPNAVYMRTCFAPVKAVSSLTSLRASVLLLYACLPASHCVECTGTEYVFTICNAYPAIMDQRVSEALSNFSFPKG
jgi:hypothetical protein